MYRVYYTSGLLFCDFHPYEDIESIVHEATSFVGKYCIYECDNRYSFIGDAPRHKDFPTIAEATEEAEAYVNVPVSINRYKYRLDPVISFNGAIVVTDISHGSFRVVAEHAPCTALKSAVSCVIR